MNRKISVGVSVALIILSIAATFALTMVFSEKIYGTLIPNLKQRNQHYAALEDAEIIVGNHFYWFDNIDQPLQLSAIVEGYVDGLGDPHSRYLDADAYKEYTERLKGELVGIGITTTFHTQDQLMYVAQVFPSSPAEKAGLQTGDIILEIDGEAVTQKNYTQMKAKLTGQRLTHVQLNYRRDRTEKTINVMRTYSNQSIDSTRIGDVGYIKIAAFYQNSVSEFQNAVDTLVKQGIKSLVFDVRNNAEGDIKYATAMIDYLVPVSAEGNQAIAKLIKSDSSVLEAYTSDANDISLPMAVIINEQTSGLAELFACDLRDFGKATLVGAKTAGNGSYQRDFRLQEGGAVLLTIAMIQPYKSASYHDVGITPDILATLTAEQLLNFDLLPQAQDAQLQAALALFQDSEVPQQETTAPVTTTQAPTTATQVTTTSAASTTTTTPTDEN